MALHTRPQRLRAAHQHRHHPDRPHQPPGQRVHRHRGPAEQGHRRRQRLRARGGHPPGRHAEEPADLRDHAAGNRRPDARASWCWASTAAATPSRARWPALGYDLERRGAEPRLRALQGAVRQEEGRRRRRHRGHRQRRDLPADGALAAGAHPGLVRQRPAPHRHRHACAGRMAWCARTRRSAPGRWIRSTRPSTASSQVPNELTEFSIKAVTEGIDAVGEVTIRIEPTAANGANGQRRGVSYPDRPAHPHLQRPRRGHRHHRRQRQGVHERAEQDADGREGAGEGSSDQGSGIRDQELRCSVS